MAKHRKPDTIDHWTTFTERIYNEWDADPGYYALSHSGLPRDQQLRAAIAWCSYYNLGIAADASELKGARFWKYLLDIYPTAKRATERRHFRGAAGLRALEQWRTNWPKPEAMADFMCRGVETYFDVRKRGQTVVQYGDYFYWKWCDLHEVLGYGPVGMRGSEKHSPKLPQQGADLIYRMCRRDRDSWVTEASVNTQAEIVVATYAEIVRFGKEHGVSPRTTDARAFDIQEAETVCCVYKQMSSGSYTYGTRTAKAVKRLRAAKSDTAAQMADSLLYLSPYNESQLYAKLDSLTEK